MSPWPVGRKRAIGWPLTASYRVKPPWRHVTVTRPWRIRLDRVTRDNSGGGAVMTSSIRTDRLDGTRVSGLVPISDDPALLPQPPTVPEVPARLSTMLHHLAAAIPGRGRQTFLELLVGGAVSRHGHVTDALLAIAPSRHWTTYFWFLEYGRWSWLAVVAALVGLLKRFFQPAVWHVIVDDTVVERRSAKAPGVRKHYNHSAKPNRPRLIHGQGWVCLAVAVERTVKGVLQVGAVPLLLLRLGRAGGHGSKLLSARVLLRWLGTRLGTVRVLMDSWYMRRPVIGDAQARGHTVIGQVRRDTALYHPPPPRAPGQRGRPPKYGTRLSRAEIEALPVQRTGRILYRDYEVVRYRSCCVLARFLQGALVRAVWVQLERPEHPGGVTKERLLLSTDPNLSAVAIILSYAQRWSIEPLFFALKHLWGWTEAWQQSRQALARWVTMLALGYALNQILAYSTPAHGADLARPAPWRAVGTLTAGTIRQGVTWILRGIGLPALLALSLDEKAAVDAPDTS